MKNVFKAVGCVAVTMIIYKFIGPFIQDCTSNRYAASFLSELFVAALAVAAAFVLGRQEILVPRLKGFGEGLATAGVQLVITTLGMAFMCAAKQITVTASGTELLFFAMEMVLIGVAEEVQFRGLIQNAAMDYFGYDSAANIRKGILFAAVLFGLVHSTNALNANVSLSSALIQSVAAIPMGALIGTVYYRSGKNLWVCILLHAITDAVGFTSSGGLGDVSQAGVIGSLSLVNLTPAVIYTIVCLWIMRKKKLESVRL